MEQANISYLKSRLEKEKSRLENSHEVLYSDRVADHFPLGKVGSSGRNNVSLNKRRSRDLEKCIDNAIDRCRIREKISMLESRIKYEETDHSGELLRLAAWFKGLKPGDTFTPGNFPLVISKVSKKSLVTEGGSKWTAEEVIGKEAAKFL